MAAIYTVRNVTGNEKATPIFNQYGLMHQTPTTITNLNIFGRSLSYQTAYYTYARNIAFFVAATAFNRSLKITGTPCSFPSGFDQMLPLSPPALRFSPSVKLDADSQDKIVSVLGPGASKSTSGRTIVFNAPNPPFVKLSTIQTISTKFFNASRDAVNPEGLTAFSVLSNLINVFCQVQSYSAFRDENEESLSEFRQLVGGELGGSYIPRTYKVKVDGKPDVEKVRRLDDSSMSVVAVEEIVRRDDKGEIISPPERMDVEEKDLNDSSGYIRFSGEDTVVYARPSTKQIVNIGHVNLVPSSPGLLFPYFPGIIQPDATHMNNIILRRFFMNLGTTTESAQAFYAFLRHGVNSLAATNRGMEFAHMLLGVDLALETQSRLFLLIDKDTYSGFVLLGARFAIFMHSKWFSSQESKELRSALENMDPHLSARDAIKVLLTGLKDKDLYSGRIDDEMFAEPRDLVAELKKLKVKEMETDAIREFDRHLRSLNYMGDGYVLQNPSTILEALSYLNKEPDIPLGRPTYLHSIKTNFDNRFYRTLSRFGTEAPSFWNDRGTEVMCKATETVSSSSTGKRKKEGTDVYGNMPLRVIAIVKPLVTAVQDLEKVVDKGRVKVDIGERAGKYRGVNMESEASKKPVWKELVELCAESNKKVKLTSDLSGPDKEDILGALSALIG